MASKLINGLLVLSHQPILEATFHLPEISPPHVALMASPPPCCVVSKASLPHCVAPICGVLFPNKLISVDTLDCLVYHENTHQLEHNVNKNRFIWSYLKHHVLKRNM